MQEELASIKLAIDQLTKQQPDYPVYVTVSKEFNDKLVSFLQWDDYKLRINQIFDAEYRVSPFIDWDIEYIIGLFDYSQILWLWNSTQDRQYKLSHLFNNLVIKRNDNEKENNESNSVDGN